MDEVETGLGLDFRILEEAGCAGVRGDPQPGLRASLFKSAGESGEVGKLYRLDRKFGPIRVVAYDERKLRIASEQDIEVR